MGDSRGLLQCPPLWIVGTNNQSRIMLNSTLSLVSVRPTKQVIGAIMFRFFRSLNWKNIIERAVAGLLVAIVSVVVTLMLV